MIRERGIFGIIKKETMGFINLKKYMTGIICITIILLNLKREGIALLVHISMREVRNNQK